MFSSSKFKSYTDGISSKLPPEHEMNKDNKNKHANWIGKRPWCHPYWTARN